MFADTGAKISSLNYGGSGSGVGGGGGAIILGYTYLAPLFHCVALLDHL